MVYELKNKELKQGLYKVLKMNVKGDLNEKTHNIFTFSKLGCLVVTIKLKGVIANILEKNLYSVLIFILNIT